MARPDLNTFDIWAGGCAMPGGTSIGIGRFAHVIGHMLGCIRGYDKRARMHEDAFALPKPAPWRGGRR